MSSKNDEGGWLFAKRHYWEAILKKNNIDRNSCGLKRVVQRNVDQARPKMVRMLKKS